MEIGNSVSATALFLLPPARGDIKLRADDRLDPGFFTFCVKFDGAEHTAVIGNRHGRHVEIFGFFNKILKPDGAVKEGILGMEMKMNKGHM
jgi:hypothetical protein